MAAITSLSLIPHYHLEEELASGWPKGKPDYLENLEVSIYALDCAIIHRINHVIEFVVNFYAGKEQLNTKTKHRHLTPLHFAAISGNMEAGEALINAGADPNAQDIRGWTALHHAALSGHEAMIRFLQVRGICSELCTLSGATYQNIIRLTQHHPLTGPTRILWRGEKGDLSPLSCEEFRKLTSAEYIEENLVSRKFLLDDWRCPIERNCEWSFSHEFKPACLSFLKNQPRHILAEVSHDSQGRKLPFKIGLGLFAERDYAAKEIIGEYVGVQEDHDVENAYVLERINSLKYRNGMAQINDGFNNVILLVLHDVEGLPKRRIFVAVEPIRKGDQFCWNYGMHSLKHLPYTELRAKEARDFIKRERIDDLMRAFLASASSHGVHSFEDCVKADRFRYILQTSATLFYMTFEGVIDGAKVQQLLDIAYRTGCIPAEAPIHLRKVSQVAIDCFKMRKLLSLCLPRTAICYIDCVKTLFARIGSRFAIQVLENTNGFLKRKIDSLKKDVDLNKIWLEREAYFFTLWKKEIDPENERAITKLLKEELKESSPSKP